MSNLPLGNLSIDELVGLGMDSDHPVLAELCRRLSPKAFFGVGGQIGLEQCKGKTILDAREIGDRLVLLLDGGYHFVVGAENDDLCGGDYAYLNFDVSLTMSEKLRLGLVSASEWDAHVQAEKQVEQKRRQAEIAQLESRLAVLRGQENG
ncbi:MAG: hypothetical protein RE468_04380 [Acidithiobacillus caldus]|uniref:hypothetical protein n=1 Tax=Acidithiobacillus caldus TaxID=33059 RepID=UPI0028162CCC|nr:hypothetical protein [Acidithiobacillus caldus]WMT47854.1 MAG: hypothetical protein RE468_04380 [Acidithiobacillus caldus]